MFEVHHPSDPAAEPRERPSDLDRAWRAVDALGGTWPLQTDPYEKGYHAGYADALNDAVAAIEKLGGRDVPGSDQ